LGKATGATNNIGSYVAADDVNAESNTGLSAVARNGNLNIALNGEAFSADPDAENYGLYVTASGNDNSWAGYFGGNVEITGSTEIKHEVAIGRMSELLEDTPLNVQGNSWDSTTVRVINADSYNSETYGLFVDFVAWLSPDDHGFSHYGVYSKSSGANTNYGIYGVAEEDMMSGTVVNYGVYGRADGTGSYNYAIYGDAGSSTTNYAGYFLGKTTVSGGDFELTSLTGENWLSFVRGFDQNAGFAFKEYSAGDTQWIFPYFRGWQSDNLIIRDEPAHRDVMTFQAGTGRVGIGTSTPSTLLHVAGTITEDSDIRLKENISPVDSALYKIGQIEGVSFNWRDPDKYDDRTHLGVIAQQVEGVFPEVVFTADDEAGTKSVDYNGLIAPLIEAVKELKTQNEALLEQNTAFKELLCQDHPTAAICK